MLSCALLCLVDANRKNTVVKSKPQTAHVSTTNSDIQLLVREQREAIVALTLAEPDVPVLTCDPVVYCDFENLEG